VTMKEDDSLQNIESGSVSARAASYSSPHGTKPTLQSSPARFVMPITPESGEQVLSAVPPPPESGEHHALPPEISSPPPDEMGMGVLPVPPIFEEKKDGAAEIIDSEEKKAEESPPSPKEKVAPGEERLSPGRLNAGVMGIFRIPPTPEKINDRATAIISEDEKVKESSPSPEEEVSLAGARMLPGRLGKLTPEAEEEAYVGPPDVRFDLYFSFGIVTDDESPSYSAYLFAIADVVRKALPQNSNISYNPLYPPYLDHDEWDSKFLSFTSASNAVLLSLVLSSIDFFNLR
jgi:hypothetical protein